MSEETTTEETVVVEPTEVFERPKHLVDGQNVIILVGDEQRQTPMPLPAIFQQMFGILGDLDRRLMAIEEKSKSSVITLAN
jgi:hypothetical protein